MQPHNDWHAARTSLEPAPETNVGKAQHALEGLEPIRPKDAARFCGAAEAGAVVSWSHFFPYLYFSGQPEAGHRLLYEVEDDAVLVYRIETKKGRERLLLLLAPFPFSLPALQRARERMWAFNGAREARIVRMQECEALLVARQGFEIYHHSDEHIYDAHAVARLEGPDFATLRRKIARYAADSSSVSVRDYHPSDEPACRALLDRWREELKTTGVSVGPYYRYTRTCLKECETIAATNLRGQVIEIEGGIGAFSFGGGITTTHASVFITVSDHSHPGLAYFQRKCLIDGLPGFKFFNDTHDSKRPGLAQMKRSFRPVTMHSIFGARRG